MRLTDYKPVDVRLDDLSYDETQKQTVESCVAMAARVMARWREMFSRLN